MRWNGDRHGRISDGRKPEPGDIGVDVYTCIGHPGIAKGSRIMFKLGDGDEDWAEAHIREGALHIRTGRSMLIKPLVSNDVRIEVIK